MGGGSSSIGIEKMKSAIEKYEGLPEGVSDEDALAAVKSALLNGVNDDTDARVVVALKSPKAQSHGSAKKERVFFESEEVGAGGDPEPDEDDVAMVIDLKFMADSGDVDSAFDLGVIYSTGEYNHKIDMDEAIRWWKKAADGESCDAAWNLAVTYHNGEKGVKRDIEAAIKYYERAADLGKGATARASIAVLQQELSAMEAAGENDDKALDWYISAAEGGDAMAAFKVGNMFANGGMGQGVDVSKAGDYWAMAAGEGHALAIENLLTFADDSKPSDELIGKVGGKEDWTRIRTLLPPEVEKALPHLQTLVAGLYRWGNGVDRDEGKCLEYLEKAAALKHAEAIYLLAGLHDTGEFDSLPQDANRAKKLFSEAAGLGHIRANAHR